MTIRLFSSDLDGTLLGNPLATLAFRKTWEALPEENRPVLCYNTGRLLADTLQLVKKTDLPEPDYLICGVGTVIYDMAKQEKIKQFTETLTVGWDLKKVESILQGIPGISKQPKKYQNPYKSSWYLENATEEDLGKIRREMEFAGLQVHVIYSSSRDMDVLPLYANKGNSLVWLLRFLEIPAEQAVVAGDTGNDTRMFLVDGIRGIVVQNAQPELLQATVDKPTYFSKEPFATGVMEGLIDYGVIEKIEPVTDTEVPRAHFDPEIRHLFRSAAAASLSSEQMKVLEEAYDKAVEALKKCVTPRGFSACALDENDFFSTDQNYKSVWGRDGAITLIGSLCIPNDDELRQCERNTLMTMVKHLSPNGQLPSNVRIEDDEPDYSGTGGIASIDSGLWVIIAFYHYVRESRDIKFLREWAEPLQRAMDWLSAHDSNNDALLEIPEAGDWTDLFGRSYNVLYDEVLWYYANICYGRLVELLGDYDKAVDYLKWAQTIKEAILRKFWPTVNPNTEELCHSYADQQYSLGETSYLLAEISPFGFDWRCDIYGNILAVLFNVLDHTRAKTAFRFMWGVGVNEPFPVANLYPTVNAGDPDWRSYYTVNLLNLPHHYHNGGIWPFIGAQWVRFISRIGLRDIALQELYKLALANREGVVSLWEFNEWLHGKTGRPMGKRFQAWSAAGFIHACHDLGIGADETHLL